MPIDPNIIIGLSTALGAGIGGGISYLAARKQYRVDAIQAQFDRLKRDYIDACQQIDAFHQIEEAHSKAAAKLSGKTEQQVKLEIRRVVEDASGLRPDWSARDARNAIKRMQI
jgi:hypothetical protein